MAAAAPVGSSDRRLALLGWLLAAVSLLLMGTVPLSMSGGVARRAGVVVGYPSGQWAIQVGMVGVLVISGAALTQVRPRNAIGWILLASGVLQGVQASADAYGIRALTDPSGSLPLARTSAWVAQWAWLPALLVVVTILPVLYPTGRAPSAFWRTHLRFAAVGIGTLVVAAALALSTFDDSVVGAPRAFTAPAWVVLPLTVVGAVLTAGATAVTLVGTVVRTVRATAPERQQLALLVSMVVVMVPAAFVSEAAFTLAYMAVPIAVAIGVLRYRLLGIEIVLRRTLLYAPLTLLVALVVGVTTGWLARLLPQGPLPLVLASALVAVLIFPAATLLRRGVDRFVLGDRHDPLGMVADVGAGLNEPSADPVTSMLTAVTAATGGSYGAVLDADGELVAERGASSAELHRVALRLGSDELGWLLVGARRSEHRVRASDARLVDALAPHVAMVVRSDQLTAALHEQRARTTRATLDERDRLRSDLHDGLGPSFSGIALGLEAVSHALTSDPTSAREILARTRAEVDSAVLEIRRVLDALRPTVLDELGLVGAVRRTAEGLGLGQPGGVQFTLVASPRLGVPLNIEEAAFRIVAESLNNVVRHAGAGTCSVQLTGADRSLRVGIADDGTGLLGDPACGSGHGLESMRRRATALGGQLDVIPAHPHGTMVMAVLPWATT